MTATWYVIHVPVPVLASAALCATCAGKACDRDHSLCNGRNEMCIGRGPAFPDHFKSNEIIAGKQFSKAKELLTAATTEVTGEVTQHCAAAVAGRHGLPCYASINTAVFERPMYAKNIQCSLYGRIMHPQYSFQQAT